MCKGEGATDATDAAGFAAADPSYCMLTDATDAAGSAAADSSHCMPTDATDAAGFAAADPSHCIFTDATDAAGSAAADPSHCMIGTKQPPSPFAQPSFYDLCHTTRCTLDAIWHCRIACSNSRTYQSRLTQDEQQFFIARLVPGCARALSSSSCAALRAVCASDSTRRLAIDDKQHERCSKVTLEWAQGVDVLCRASGTLPLAIKLHIDARKCGRSNLNTVLGWDPSRVRVMDLDARERALLREAWRDVQQTGRERTVLVLIFISMGRTAWPHQEYDGHVTKIVLKPLREGPSEYEDHAMAKSDRLEVAHRRAWARGGQVYIEPDPRLLRVEGANGPGKRKRSPASGSTARPEWACAEQATELVASNRWGVRVYELLAETLKAEGGELRHDQVYALQSFDTAQCAVAVLFDLFAAVPDGRRREVCAAFLAHPDRRPPRAKAGGDDRSGNDVMLQLFEAWLLSTHREVFAAAAAWRRENSLRIGDLRSSGVCDLCDQLDCPGELLLCEEPTCPCAVHTFCSGASMADEWRCASHHKAAGPSNGAVRLRLRGYA